jgi:hypothetical protein
VPLRSVLSVFLMTALLMGHAATASPVAAAEQLRSGQTGGSWSGLVLPADQGEDDRSFERGLRQPEGPTDAHRPRFVRQTGKNCAFASVSMLIDRWTGGATRPNQARLRTASRVPASEGVSFGELSRAVARESGLDLRYSPSGGDPMTWDQLLARLTRGGGAVVGGAYSRLPSHYQRWARGFASLGVSGSGHAVYVERYEAGRGGGRVWLMDPLANRSGHRGEWISARALHKFAWSNSKGLISAAATPEPPVLAGFEFGPAALDEWLIAGGELKVKLPFTKQRGWPKPPTLRLAASWELLEPEAERSSFHVASAGAPAGVTVHVGQGGEIELAPISGGKRGTSQPEGQVSGTEVKPDKASRGSVKLTRSDDHLVGVISAPTQAGLHQLTLELRDAEGGTFRKGRAPAIAPLTVHVNGELAAEWSLLPILEEPVQGVLNRVQVDIVNRGSLDWLEHETVTIVASWDTAVGSLPGGSARLELASGRQGVFTVNTRVPSRVSEGTLRLELIDAGGVPLAEFGAEHQLVWLRFSSAGDAEGPAKPSN